MSDVCTGLSDKQPGVEGHIFNTVGSGVRGGGTPGYVTYGAAKRGLPQMTDSLVAELDGKTQGYDWPAAAEKGRVNVPTCHQGACCHELPLATPPFAVWSQAGGQAPVRPTPAARRGWRRRRPWHRRLCARLPHPLHPRRHDHQRVRRAATLVGGSCPCRRLQPPVAMGLP